MKGGFITMTSAGGIPSSPKASPSRKLRSTPPFGIQSLDAAIDRLHLWSADQSKQIESGAATQEFEVSLLEKEPTSVPHCKGGVKLEERKRTRCLFNLR